MGELILVSGPNGSGKSRFAEGLIAGQQRRERFYIAALRPVTEDNFRRIEAHRRQRAGLGFVTLELPDRVGDAPVGPDSAVLLEDVSNLLANALFGGEVVSNGPGAAAETGERVFRDILRLRGRCGVLAAVTISGLRPEDWEGDTQAFVRELNRLNQRLLEAADAATELREGIPVWLDRAGEVRYSEGT